MQVEGVLERDHGLGDLVRRARERELPELGATAQDVLVEGDFSLPERREQGRVLVVARRRDVQLVDDTHRGVVEVVRNALGDCEMQLPRRVALRLHGSEAAVVEALEHLLVHLDEQPVEVGVVVEDRADGESGAVGDVLEAQA